VVKENGIKRQTKQNKQQNNILMSMDKPEIENLESLVKTTTALQRTRKETTEREREREISPVPPAPALAPPWLYYCPFSSLSLQTKSPGPRSRPLPRRPPPPLHATANLASTKFSLNIERHESNSLSRSLSLFLLLRLFFSLLSTIQLRTSLCYSSIAEWGFLAHS
jgi:hypothetical protein